MSSRLFTLSAPSGAGKTSLVQALRQRHPHIALAVSHTTRPPRRHETDGVNYHFVSPQQFESMIEAGSFVEHARVFSHWYGTSRAAIDAALPADAPLLLEIDWQGAAQVRTLFPESNSIFILPPSRAVLESRLIRRGQDEPATIARRTREALEEMRHYKDADFLLVNDDFDQSLQDLEAILDHAPQHLQTGNQQERYRELIAELLSDKDRRQN